MAKDSPRVEVKPVGEHVGRLTRPSSCAETVVTAPSIDLEGVIALFRPFGLLAMNARICLGRCAELVLAMVPPAQRAETIKWNVVDLTI